MKESKKAGFLNYAAAPIMTIVLYTISSISFYLIFKDISTVFVFIIIASIISIMMVLYAVAPYKAKNIFRIINAFLISALLFGMAGVLARQNFQIEGFFFYVFAGVFGGVIVHYSMKIIGPLFTGRAWCGWSCWTMVILDLLPFKKNTGWKKGNFKYLKYIHFIVSAAVVAILVFGFKYVIHNPNQDSNQPGTLKALYWLLAGNTLYYISGIILAMIFKDNRAFCKYLCPVSVFLKMSNIFSVLRIKGNKEKCTNCGACVRKCLFSIDIPKYTKEGTRVKSSECVMCMKCIATCPEGALSASIGFDLVTKDNLKIK